MQGNYDRQQIIDFLNGHLKKIESTRNHILKEFYEACTEDRDNFKRMVEEYISHIKDFMNANIDFMGSEQWPFVLIGSIVEVQDLDYDIVDKLKIVPPFFEDNTTKLDCASCLSPVGHALLLKKIGDKVTAKTPLGNCNFMIKSIALPLN
ncbi:MAG: GreA/GreB family elongation factor [Caldicoprobacterales bacterium]|nr:GreA/GreB family elongation factor [Clostridiales bacterium]